MDFSRARTRKFFGVFAILAFIGFYAWAMSSVGDFVPRHWAAQMVFYIVAGMGWGVPILPLISWMNRGR